MSAPRRRSAGAGGCRIRLESLPHLALTNLAIAPCACVHDEQLIAMEKAGQLDKGRKIKDAKEHFLPEGHLADLDDILKKQKEEKKSAEEEEQKEDKKKKTKADKSKDIPEASMF